MTKRMYSEYGHGMGISYSNSAKSGHCGWMLGDVCRKGAGRLPARDCDFCLRGTEGCSGDGTNYWWHNHRDEGEGSPKDTNDNQIQLWQMLN